MYVSPRTGLAKKMIEGLKTLVATASPNTPNLANETRSAGLRLLRCSKEGDRQHETERDKKDLRSSRKPVSAMDIEGLGRKYTVSYTASPEREEGERRHT